LSPTVWTRVRRTGIVHENMSLGVLPHLLWTGRFIHFLGLGMAVGAALAAVLVFRKGLEQAALEAVGRVEIPGVFLAILGGILLVVAQPDMLDPETSGAGPWLHVKLAFVMGVLVVAHMRMFNVQRLVRSREANEAKDELDLMVAKGKKLDSASLTLYLVVLFVAVFRVMLFA
jgi:hypothetical protein